MQRGIILIIIGLVLFFPVAIAVQMILPFPYGIITAIAIGPGVIIAGVISLIKERKQQSYVSYQKYCTKCGSEMLSSSVFCSKCGAKS